LELGVFPAEDFKRDLIGSSNIKESSMHEKKAEVRATTRSAKEIK